MNLWTIRKRNHRTINRNQAAQAIAVREDVVVGPPIRTRIRTPNPGSRRNNRGISSNLVNSLPSSKGARAQATRLQASSREDSGDRNVAAVAPLASKNNRASKDRRSRHNQAGNSRGKDNLPSRLEVPASRVRASRGMLNRGNAARASKPRVIAAPFVGRAVMRKRRSAGVALLAVGKLRFPSLAQLTTIRCGLFRWVVSAKSART